MTETEQLGPLLTPSDIAAGIAKDAQENLAGLDVVSVGPLFAGWRPTQCYGLKAYLKGWLGTSERGYRTQTILAWIAGRLSYCYCRKFTTFLSSGCCRFPPQKLTSHVKTFLDLSSPAVEY
jgi:hypothetical protein